MYKKIALILLFAVLTAAGCQKNASGDQPVHDPIGGDKAPAFTLKSTDGKDVSLADFKGKVVIVDFWATWCGPCRRGIPDLISLQKEYKDKLIVIGISLDRETKADVVPFIQKNGVNYPVVFGDENVINGFGGVQAIPTSFVIDQKGNIVDKHVGLVEKSVFSDKIKQLLGES